MLQNMLTSDNLYITYDLVHTNGFLAYSWTKYNEVNYFMVMVVMTNNPPDRKYVMIKTVAIIGNKSH